MTSATPEQSAFDPITANVEPIRAAFRNSAGKLIAAGRIEAIDAGIGAIYAAHDFALQSGMDVHGAIEWMRNATDLMERQLLAAARPNA